MTDRIWLLGASDPEMEAIETLLTARGEHVIYARDSGGRRVHPGNAYEAVEPDMLAATVYLVECATRRMCCGARLHEERDADECGVCGGWPQPSTVHIDHHRPGDAGFGRPPEKFLAASSIGQVLAVLEQEPSAHQRLVAAADHCLAAAYRGACPGVDPDALMHWRAASRAEFQGREVVAVLADIKRASQALAEAPVLILDYDQCPHHRRVVAVADMRRPEPVPELPEAAARLDCAYVSGPLTTPDGRSKYTCSGREEEVRAFLEVWAPEHNLEDCYGDPARGFAGGYLASR